MGHYGPRSPQTVLQCFQHPKWDGASRDNILSVQVWFVVLPLSLCLKYSTSSLGVCDKKQMRLSPSQNEFSLAHPFFFIFIILQLSELDNLTEQFTLTCENNIILPPSVKTPPRIIHKWPRNRKLVRSPDWGAKRAYFMAFTNGSAKSLQNVGCNI